MVQIHSPRPLLLKSAIYKTGERPENAKSAWSETKRPCLDMYWKEELFSFGFIALQQDVPLLGVRFSGNLVTRSISWEENALRILWPCAEPRSSRTLSKLTVERCQCNIPANRVLPCERSSQLDSIVTTEPVIPCQGFRTRHECLRYRNSREVRPLSREYPLSLPAAVIIKNTEAHSAR